MGQTVLTPSARPYMRALRRDLPAEPASPVASPAKPQILAVASGKGGVGKTWFSLTLVHAMLRENPGMKLLIVDGDFGLGNVDIQLGLRHRYDITHVLSHRISLTAAITRYVFPDDAEQALQVDILPAHSGAAALTLMHPERVQELLTVLRDGTDYDLVLVDLCAGIDKTSRMIAASADQLLVVTTEEPTALTDAYAVLKLATRDRRLDGLPDMNAGVVVNQASGMRSGESVYNVLAGVCRRFLTQTPDFTGVVRRDRRVPEAIRLQHPFLERYPTSAAALDVTRIARKLVQMSEVD